jgi:prolyl oligopeptidase
MRPSSLLSLVLIGACAAPHAVNTPGVRLSQQEPPAADPLPPLLFPHPAPSRFPATRRGDDADVLHGVTVADPYRWLEDASNPDVQAWMAQQDGLARAALAKLPARDALARRFRELYYIDSFGVPEHKGKRWFFTRKHADKEKGVSYYRDARDGADHVLVDPNTLSEDGSVTLRGLSPSDDGRYVAYRLSRNNADSAILHVRDLATGKDLPDTIDDARYAAASWTPDSKGFYYTWIPKDASIPRADLPGYQEIRYHALGTDSTKDPVLVPALHDATKFLGVDLSFDGRWLFVTVSHGWRSTDVWYKDLKARPGDAKRRPQVVPDEGAPFAAAGFAPLVVGQDHHYAVTAWKDVFYIATDEGAPRFRLFSVAGTQPARARWKEILPERADATLGNVQVVGGRLALAWTRNAHSELEIRGLDGRPVRTIELPGLGATTAIVGRPDEDELYFDFSSYLGPTQVFSASVKSGKTTLWQAAKVPLDASKIVVEQVWYPSKDGTRVSMFLIHQKDWQKTGANPTYLWGYGGFDVNITPGWNPAMAVFVEHGGVVAVTNLRGGGEYGEDWHKAGMLERKQNVFDDFIGAAEYLIAEKITQPAKLAIEGRSNGGLLVGATMTQRPELFKAVVCGVPLLDMIRYHLFGSGKTWAEEYGTSADEKLFPAILAYSPYQNVKAGTRYPALLMLSVDSDDRVDPLHARKFVAAIQWATASDAPVLLRIEKNAGHTGADLNAQAVENRADTFAFLFDQLGMN